MSRAFFPARLPKVQSGLRSLYAGTLVVVMCAIVSHIAAASAAGQDGLEFRQFKVNKVFRGTNARPMITGENRMFRTRLRQAAKRKPNFAGEYIVALWGCGASCVNGAVINARTGRITRIPHNTCCWPVAAEDPIAYRLDSRLIVFSGLRNESESDKEGDKHYYEFKNGRFVFLRTVRE